MANEKKTTDTALENPTPVNPSPSKEAFTPLVCALDADDTLFKCLKEACDMVKIDYARITDFDLTKTDLTETERSALLYTMSQESFVEKQEPIEGAIEMVNKLIERGHTVLISSAVDPSVMTTRGMMLMKMFPMINPKNIMLGARKELLNVDVLLDDNPYNLKGENAKYRVLMSQPHNENATGFLRVRTYDEFLEFVDKISKLPESNLAHVRQAGEPGAVLLVGPSGAGKTAISDLLTQNPTFKKIRALTDRPMREGEKNGVEYNFVSPEQFDKAVKEKKLLESTTYAGHNYGIAQKEIEGIWKDGRIGIKPIDIDGARAIKNAYPDRVLTIFVRRDKDSMIRSIVERNSSVDDKVARIMSIDKEYQNEHLCDFTVFNNGSLEHAVDQIIRML